MLMTLLEWLTNPLYFMIYAWTISFVASLLLCHNKAIPILPGMILTLALGPLSFILLIAAKTDDAALEERAIAKGQLKRCLKCHEVVRKEATRCRYCRSDIIVF